MQDVAPLATRYLNLPGVPADLTQAETLTFAGCSEAVDGTRTRAVAPSKPSALPRLPSIHVAAPSSVPWFARPESSAALAPLPSSKLQCPTTLVAALAGATAINSTAAVAANNPFAFMAIPPVLAMLMPDQRQSPDDTCGGVDEVDAGRARVRRARSKCVGLKLPVVAYIDCPKRAHPRPRPRRRAAL